MDSHPSLGQYLGTQVDIQKSAISLLYWIKYRENLSMEASYFIAINENDYY